MRRRELITLLGGASVAWPFAARAQQPVRMRRIGVLMSQSTGDQEGQARVTAFLQGLQQLGWTDGQNVQIDIRWGAGDAERIGRYATELVAQASDVILASGGTVERTLQQATRTIPIVFVNAADPVGGGMVASLARPGGNATGFTQYEYAMSGKWLELLKEIVPRITRAVIVRDPSNPAAIGQLGAIQALAPSVGVDVSLLDERNASEIKRVITALGGASNGGFIVLTGTGNLKPDIRNRIITLAAQHRVPGIYPYRYFVTGGGLISYGPDTIDPYLRAAGYVDRILKGEKPADLPVQAPTKYELVINLKTAKAVGITFPQTVTARADEVIE
jgi:putative ABC transport system substrate-binding protein